MLDFVKINQQSPLFGTTLRTLLQPTPTQQTHLMIAHPVFGVMSLFVDSLEDRIDEKQIIRRKRHLIMKEIPYLCRTNGKESYYVRNRDEFLPVRYRSGAN